MNKDDCEDCNDCHSGCHNLARNVRGAVVLSGRPKRDTPISREDVIDLQIALYSSKSLSEFLAQV